MGAKHFDSRVYEMPAENIIEVIKSHVYADELNLALKSENPTETGVWYRFHHGVTFTSWGEKITVTITALPGNTTKVDILSECGMPTQMVDFGKNQRNVNTLFSSLEKHLSRRTKPPVEQPPAPKAPVLEPPKPVAPVAETVNSAYCSKCGALLAPDAAFCSKCGAKVEVPVEPVCPNCKKVLNAGDAFCSGCGTKL